tara:strand:+ start:2527 stop:2958 length:432 start_codon:yes stop_codon:yes gene_type:complete
MTNSDTQFGTYNKLTKEIRAYWNQDPAAATVRNEEGRDENSSVIYQKFGGNVETAKSLFLTDAALTSMNDNATELDWAITDDNNGLKFTIAFGTKSDHTATSWADAWSTEKSSLQDANGYFKAQSPDRGGHMIVVTDSGDHLF